ncbi:MAG: hypothetical protein ACLQO1_01420 [Steroidobacteraceae bacterium]
MVMDIYAAMADGVWLYEPKTHTLLPHLANDIRAQTGTQDFVASAPLNLIYVAHGERMSVSVRAADRNQRNRAHGGIGLLLDESHACSDPEAFPKYRRRPS